MNECVEKRVLISGLGIAGPTLAYWLKRQGWQPVIVEEAAALRTGGYIIDFWGAGYDVAGRMGLLTKLDKGGYRVEEVRLVNAENRRVGGFSADIFRKATGGRYVSLGRETLARVLYSALDGVDVIWSDSIAAIEQGISSVTVSFNCSAQRVFDLVIGADGIHSNVRRLVFGDDQHYERYLGYKVAAFQASGYRPRDANAYVAYSEPGRQAARFATRDGGTMFLLVNRDPDPQVPHSADQRKLSLHRAFGGSGWECPRILSEMDALEDIYVDRVSQIQLPAWTHGRVALVGDAAYCPSLLAGEGAALAMVGAYVLAGELGKTGADYHTALQRYESRLRAFIDKKKRAAASFASSFVPSSRLGIALHNFVTGAFRIPFVADLALGNSVRDGFELPKYESHVPVRLDNP